MKANNKLFIFIFGSILIVLIMLSLFIHRLSQEKEVIDNKECIAGITKQISDIEKNVEPIIVYEVQQPKEKYDVLIKDTPSNNGFKSYMDSDYITYRGTAQYELKNKYELSDIGIYKIGDRYCIAMGSYYSKKIGTNIDLVMSNGNIIKCILADCKDDKHTDESNRQNPNGSIAEFVVDTKSLSQEVLNSGDLSLSNDNLLGEIAYVIVYD